MRLLDEEGTRPEAAFWLYSSESGEWRLVLADPLVASTGPRKAYERIQRLLASPEAQGGPIALDDVQVIRADAPMVLSLRATIPKGARVRGLRLSNNVVAGTVIDDSYFYRVTPEDPGDG